MFRIMYNSDWWHRIWHVSHNLLTRSQNNAENKNGRNFTPVGTNWGAKLKGDRIQVNIIKQSNIIWNFSNKIGKKFVLFYLEKKNFFFNFEYAICNFLFFFVSFSHIVLINFILIKACTPKNSDLSDILLKKCWYFLTL